MYKKMNRSLISAVVLFFFALHFNVNAESSEHILAPIKQLNKGLSERDTSVIYTSFSDEFEWENSYGWTIRSKEKLAKFFDEWMFKQFPKSSTAPDIKYKITQISDDSSWVDTVQRIQLGNNVLHIRQVHLVVKASNRWTIAKTRIWRMRHSDSPPKNYVKELDVFVN